MENLEGLAKLTQAKMILLDAEITMQGMIAENASYKTGPLYVNADFEQLRVRTWEKFNQLMQ